METSDAFWESGASKTPDGSDLQIVGLEDGLQARHGLLRPVVRPVGANLPRPAGAISWRTASTSLKRALAVASNVQMLWRRVRTSPALQSTRAFMTSGAAAEQLSEL